MLLFCGAPSFQAELATTFHSLVEDPHALVRRTIACGFHEVREINLSDINYLDVKMDAEDNFLTAKQENACLESLSC